MASGRHYLLMPFAELGHIIPMLELAKKIRVKHQVTLVVSAMKVPILTDRKMLPADIPLIALDDGVLENFQSDLELKQFRAGIAQMLVAQKEFIINLPNFALPSSSQSPVKKPVTAIIFDTTFPEALRFATQRGIRSYFFNCASALIVAGGLAITEETPTIPDETWHGKKPSEEGVEVTKQDTAVHEFAGAGIHESLKTMVVELNSCYQLAEAVLVNSFEDLEAPFKQMFEMHPTTKGRKMKFVGPLIPVDEAPNAVDEQVKMWLDKQQEMSVVYVSFGSQALPNPAQVAAIAEGLVDAKRPFIWSLRSQHEFLPEWFRQLMKKQFDGDFLVLHWAPQKLILAHPATQIFLTHCGWNSTLEGVSGGVSLVLWPMFGDQHLNADFLAQLGNSVRIPGTSSKAHRIVPKEEITAAIETVTKKGPNSEPNSFEATAAHFKEKARLAVSEGGKSQRDFQELFI